MAKIIKHITVTPTITAGAYSAADNVGGLLKFKDNDIDGQGTIVGIAVADASKQSIDLDIFFFHTSPAGSTFTDNAAQAVIDADITKIFHVENVTAYDALSDNSVATVASINTKVDFTDGIYAAIVTRGTPTYVATSDLDITVTVEFEE